MQRKNPPGPGLWRRNALTLILLLSTMAPSAWGVIAAEDRLKGLTSTLMLANYAPEADPQDLMNLRASVESFQKDPASASAMSSPQGVLFKKLHAKLVNFLQIRNTLSQCPIAPVDSHLLSTRILAAADVSADKIELCSQYDLNGPANSSQILKTAIAEQKTELEGLIYGQSMANSSATLALMKNNFGYVSQDTEADINELCTDKKQGTVFCDPKLRKKMFAANQQAVAELGTNPAKPFTFQAAADQVNEFADTIAKARNGEDASTPPLDPTLTSLLYTDKLRAKVGSLFELTNKKHQPQKITADDMRAAFNEARTSILDDVQELSTSYHDGQSKAAVDENLRDLVRRDPIAVGQILINNPELAPLVCWVMIDIEKASNKKSVDYGKWAMVAGELAGGGTLLLSGIGAKPGEVMVMSAGTAIFSAAAATLSGVDAHRARREQQALQAAFLAGRGDELTEREADAKHIEFRHDLGKVLWNLAIGVPGAGKLVGVLRETGHLPELAELLNTISSDLGLFKAIELLRGTIGESKTVELLIRLARMGKSARTEALNLIRATIPPSAINGGVAAVKAAKAAADKIEDGVEALERSGMWGKAVAKGLKFTYNIQKQAAKEWRYVGMSTGVQTGTEGVIKNLQDKEVLFDNPVTIAKNLLADPNAVQDLGFMTTDTWLQAGIAFGQRSVKQKFVLCGVISIGASVASSVMAKGTPDPVRIAGDASWESSIGSIETLANEKAVRFFREKALTRPHLHLVGFAVAAAFDATEMGAYSEAAHAYESLRTHQAEDLAKAKNFHLVPLFEPD